MAIIAAATAVWSLATILSGAATSFLFMMVARVAVGMGEAGFSAPAASLVADQFSARRRASACSLIWLGLPIGTLLGAIGGGLIAQAHGWRMAFVALGAPGLVVALLVWWLLHEPVRGLVDGVAPPRVVPPFAAVVRHVLAMRTLRHIMIGGAVCTIGVQGVAQFMPLLFTRLFHMPIGAAAGLFGLVSGVSLSLGLLLGALGTDRLSHTDERWPAWGPALALLLAPLCYLLGFSQHSVPAMAALLIGGGVMAMVYYGPSVGVLQNLTPPSMRASTSAVFAMLTALVGTGVGPTFVGFASDRLAALSFAGGHYAQFCSPRGPTAGADIAQRCSEAASMGLRQAMMLSVLSFAWAAVHFYLASRSLREDLATAHAAARLAAQVA